MLYSIGYLHKKHNFSILHAYYLTPAGFIATMSSKLINVPCVVSIRGNDIARDFLDNKQFHWIEWTLKNANYITALNEELYNIANAIYPIKNKSKVVINSTYFPYKIQGRKENSKIIIGYIREVKRKKGLIYLLEALKLLKNEDIELHKKYTYCKKRRWKRHNKRF